MGDEIYAYVYVWLGSHAVHWGEKSVSEITIKTKLKKKREREMKKEKSQQILQKYKKP